MKKVYLLGVILAASAAHLTPASANADGAVAVAAPQAGCPKAFQGFGLKGIIAYGIGKGKQKYSNAVRPQGVQAFTTDETISNDLGFSGFDGGVGVDYTHRLCNWAVGLGFDATWASTDGKFTQNFVGNQTGSLKARLKNSLQLYAKLGYVMREIAMPFIALGWDNSQWKHNGSVSFAGNAFPTESFSKSKRYNAFLWRVGVDFLATKHVVVGAEYTGTIAGRKSVSKNFTDANGNVTRHSASFKPQANKFALTAKIVY